MGQKRFLMGSPLKKVEMASTGVLGGLPAHLILNAFLAQAT